MSMLANAAPHPAAGPKAGRVAVIDIGSNSLRLVVYERLARVPVPLFNEKVLCGLGRDLSRTGLLNPQGIGLALDTLSRFARLLRGMQVREVHVLATAAVRDAADGTNFVHDAMRRCGLQASVISGAEEARLSAMGLLCGVPSADGVMGDLGGGSLELVGLDQGRIGPQDTSPLGPFRLMDRKGGKKAARGVVDEALGELGWLSGYAGRRFYAIGGAWRSLAKAHMEAIGHPLHIVQEYTVACSDMAALATEVAGGGKRALERFATISKRRLDILPYAAMVMQAVLERVTPTEVVFSALGLREGFLYDRLPEDDRRADPLLAGCADIAGKLNRFAEGERLTDWSAGLFADREDRDRFERLRQAACLLSDIGWAEHPDYRAELASLRVLRLPLVGLGHRDRAFLAMATAMRYGASAGARETQEAAAMLPAGEAEAATVLGLALRLAHTLSGGAAEVLTRTELHVAQDTVWLILPEDEMTLAGDAVVRRLDTLAKALNRVGRVTFERDKAHAAAGA
jgi:exopolyphosphatase/guanosine-5'-triphosphate,3'-diphosphate pyrophosphatase